MTEFLHTWQVLIIPLAVMIISQVIKVVLESRKEGGFKWRHLNNYGGMPSSHTALFVSLTLIIGFTQGFSSPLFIMAGILAAVFIRDAVGIRWQLGFHGRVLNRIINTLPKEDREKLPKKLEERLGHTEGEAIAGGVLGVLLTILFYVLFQ